MRHDVAYRGAKGAQPVRLADDERVQRDREHQRKLARLLQHLVELVDDHLGELPAGMVASDQRRQIVVLGRVGHRQDRPGARPHPDRLVVDRPVHHIAVARFLQEVRGEPALGQAGAEPALRPLAGEPGDRVGRLDPVFP